MYRMVSMTASLFFIYLFKRYLGQVVTLFVKIAKKNYNRRYIAELPQLGSEWFIRVAHKPPPSGQSVV